jgi:hypothetical protein
MHKLDAYGNIVEAPDEPPVEGNINDGRAIAPEDPSDIIPVTRGAWNLIVNTLIMLTKRLDKLDGGIDATTAPR